MTKQQLQLTSSECVELVDKRTNKVYKFFIGQDEHEQWCCWTNNPVTSLGPHFVLECNDREDAMIMGYASIRMHIAGLNSNASFSK